MKIDSATFYRVMRPIYWMNEKLATYCVGCVMKKQFGIKLKIAGKVEFTSRQWLKKMRKICVT